MQGRNENINIYIFIESKFNTQSYENTKKIRKILVQKDIQIEKKHNKKLVFFVEFSF